MSKEFKNSHNYDENFAKFREKFFNFLLRKPCTSGQAEKYLSQHDVPEHFCILLLDEAVNTGLIDDISYAKLFVDGHLSWGNKKIIYELLNKGVSREKIDEAVNESEDETSRACELAENWLKLGIDKRKIINRLLSRGFSHIPQI